MNTCFQCGEGEAVIEGRWCSQACRRAWLCQQRADSRVDWLAVRLRMLAVQRGWNAEEERLRRAVPQPRHWQPPIVEVLTGDPPSDDD